MMGDGWKWAVGHRVRVCTAVDYHISKQRLGGEAVVW